MKAENKKSATAPKKRNRVVKKPKVLTCRVSGEIKKMLREKAKLRGMNMTDYIAYLIKKDRPK